jgi:hypothetical protein
MLPLIYLTFAPVFAMSTKTIVARAKPAVVAAWVYVFPEMHTPSRIIYSTPGLGLSSRAEFTPSIH